MNLRSHLPIADWGEHLRNFGLRALRQKQRPQGRVLTQAAVVVAGSTRQPWHTPARKLATNWVDATHNDQATARGRTPARPRISVYDGSHEQLQVASTVGWKPVRSHC